MVPPLALSFWRWTLALALVTTVAWPQVKRDRAVLIARWPLILALAATGVATFGALLYVGLHTTTALNSVLLQAAIPPLIMLFAWLFQGERTSVRQTLGVALSLAGVLVVISGTAGPGTCCTWDWKPGDALISIGVVVYAIYALILRKAQRCIRSACCWATFAMAALLLAPFYGLEAMAGAKLKVSPAMLLGLGYVALFPSFLAYLFFNRGVELAGPARAGHFMHLMPIFGGLLAVTLLGEAFAPFHAVGAVLIGLGIAAASLGRRAEKAA